MIILSKFYLRSSFYQFSENVKCQCFHKQVQSYQILNKLPSVNSSNTVMSVCEISNQKLQKDSES